MKSFSLFRILWIAVFMQFHSVLFSQTINFQNFNTGINGGWTAVNGGSTPDTWVQVANFQGNTLNGSGFAWVNSDAVPATPARTLNESLQSPLFNGNLYTNVYLEFDHYYRDYSTDTGFVEVFNGTSWIRVAFYSTNQGAWNAPSHVFLDLTLYRNPNMRVRFRYEDDGVWAWYWAVDNVLIWAPYNYDANLYSRLAPRSDCAMTAAEQVGVRIYNAGADTLTSFNVSYRINNGAIITEAVSTVLLPVDTLDYFFTTTANLSTPGNYVFKFWVSTPGDVYVLNDTLANVSVYHYPVVNNLPYYLEDFDAGAGSWFSGGTASTWALGTPAKDVIIGASSAPNAWVTGGLGTTNHADNEKSQVNSPCFDFSSWDEPWVVMDVWWNAEYSWDGAALQGSSNGGQTWTTIGVAADPFNWYTDNSLGGLPGGQQQGWTGRNASGNGSGSWRTAKHNLIAFAHQPEVIFRVAFGSDPTVNDDGFAFDNFVLTNAPNPNLGPDTVICDSIVLNPGAYPVVSWSNGVNAPTLTVDDDATLIVTVQDTFGISGRDTVEVTLFVAEGPALGPDVELCEGETLTLDAGNGGILYDWSHGDSTQFTSISQSGTYSVFVQFPYGCTGTDTLTADFHNLYAGYVEPDTICRDEPVQFTDTSTGATSWYWDFGNGFNSTLQNPTFVFLQGGTFLVSMTASDGVCTETITKPIFVQLCNLTSAAEPSSLSISLAPNPAQTETWLKTEGINGEAQVTLLDLRGIAQWQGVLPAGMHELKLPLAALAAGVYLVQVEAAEDRQVIRLVVE